MSNQMILVGRLTKDVQIEQIDDDKIIGIINLAIPRSLKNENGEYDTDFVDITLTNQIASNTAEYCKKGDIVGVKGKIESYGEEHSIRLVAEKVTFISSRKSNEVE